MAPRTDRLPISIFYSYAHEDEKLRQQLDKHLSILKRQKLIEEWHDREINAGEEWKREIEKHLDSAHIILLLISADFINSDFCYAKEMERALERHRVGAGAQLAQGWAAYINETTIFDLATPLSIAGSALLFTLLTWRIPKLAGALASGVTSLGVSDVFGVAGGAVRFAAMAVPAGQIAAGTMTIAHAASQGADGGVRGALSGMSAAGGALSREVSAASVPRLHQAARRINTQADAMRRPAADTQSGETKASPSSPS